MAKILSSGQGLDKKEQESKDFIELAFLEHEGEWADTSRRLIDAYHGRYFASFEKSNRFTVNTFFSIVNLLLPNLVFTQPYILTKAKNARYFKKLVDGEYQVVDAIRAAQVREAALNYKYTAIGAFGEQRKAVLDALFYGFGITKTGYSYETSSAEDKDFVIKDSPFVKRINPLDFGWHPLATGIDDSPKLCHRMLTSMKRLKAAGEYTSLDKVTEVVPSYLKKRFKNASKLKNTGYVPICEVHDAEQDKIYTFAGDNQILIGKKDNPYLFKGSHFNMVRLAGDNDLFMGVSLLAMVEDEAIALNEMLTLIMQHIRKYPAMLFYQTGSLDPDDVEKIRTGEQGSMHEVRDISQIKVESPIPMGGDYLNIIAILQGMIDRILGILDFQRALSSTRKSATEASIIQGDASVRREFFIQEVKNFILRDINKVADLQAQFQDKEEEIMASGNLASMPFKYDKTDIQGDFDFDFDVDVLKASNTEQLNVMNNLLQIMAGNEVLNPVLKSLDPVKLGKKLFQKAGLFIESLQTGDPESSIYVSPEKENEIARRNEPMPAPKKGEDYGWHIQVHTDDIRKNGDNEQILDHIASTILLAQRERSAGLPVPGGSPIAFPNQGQEEGAAALAPQGPLQVG